MKSEKLDLLASALAKAQSEMPTIPMTAVNPFLKNKYADLATMIKVATPVLAKNGLSISQQPVTTDGRIGVTTTLLHTSGQWIEDTITLPLGDERGKSLAQVAGSIITYLRRYSYGAIVGLATDEDTDGNHPAKTEYKTPEPKPAVKDDKPAKEYQAESQPVGQDVDADKKYNYLSAAVVSLVKNAKGLDSQDAVRALNELKANGRLAAANMTMDEFRRVIGA